MIDLQPVSLDDVDAIHALIERAYRGDSAKQGWTHEADLLDGQRTDRDALRDMIEDRAQHLLGWWQDGTPVACVAVTQKAGGLAYIGMVTVDPRRQANGLGRALLDAAETYARERLACATAEMTVISLRRELIEWYERRGYARTGERRPFPHGDPRFGLPRRNDLEFVVLAKAIAA